MKLLWRCHFTMNLAKKIGAICYTQTLSIIERDCVTNIRSRQTDPRI
jgi:hypothetical protein